jgi:hypothetical protein
MNELRAVASCRRTYHIRSQTIRKILNIFAAAFAFGMEFFVVA